MQKTEIFGYFPNKKRIFCAKKMFPTKVGADDVAKNNGVPILMAKKLTSPTFWLFFSIFFLVRYTKIGVGITAEVGGCLWKPFFMRGWASCRYFYRDDFFYFLANFANGEIAQKNGYHYLLFMLNLIQQMTHTGGIVSVAIRLVFYRDLIIIIIIIVIISSRVIRW